MPQIKEKVNMGLDEVRTYRNWMQVKDLVSFTVKIAESDLLIRAERELYAQAEQSLREQRRLIQDYICRNPIFATTLKPYLIEDEAPEIVQEMVKTTTCAGVGPMAAVAGAVAEYVGKDLLQYSQEIIVENGGDIFMKTKRTRKVGIFAGASPYTGKLAIEIAPGEDYWGICTSSGTVGPSLSFGQADAAIVVCNSAILADAWATRAGNMVKTAQDVEKTLKFVQGQPGIKGLVIIIGDKIGAWGELKLVKS